MPSHYIIIGAGISGILCAYHTLKRCPGARVTIIDAHDAPAAGASGANACQLSFTGTMPVANPSLPAAACKAAARTDAHLGTSYSPQSFYYGMRFLAHTRPAIYRRDRMRLRRYARAARRSLQQILDDTGIALQAHSFGKLQLYSKDASARAGHAYHHACLKEGDAREFPDRDALARLMPGLTVPDVRFAAFLPEDEAADCPVFCADMLTYLQRHHDVTFIPNTYIGGSDRLKNGVVTAIYDSEGTRYNGDAFIFCPGATPCPAAAHAGFRPPIFPVSGVSVRYYGLTDIPVTVSATFIDKKMVWAPLGDTLLISGLFRFGDRFGKSAAADTRIVHEEACKLFPPLRDAAHTARSGVRPCTPDSYPYVKRINNAVYAGGLGMYGWTLAASAAERAARILSLHDMNSRI